MQELASEVRTMGPSTPAQVTSRLITPPAKARTPRSRKVPREPLSVSWHCRRVDQVARSWVYLRRRILSLILSLSPPGSIWSRINGLRAAYGAHISYRRDPRPLRVRDEPSVLVPAAPVVACTPNIACEAPADGNNAAPVDPHPRQPYRVPVVDCNRCVAMSRCFRTPQCTCPFCPSGKPLCFIFTAADISFVLGSKQ